MITKKEHIKIHKDLHASLDKLTADFILITGKMPSETSVMELMNWAYEQTKNPTVKK